jgi:hypothetical protein
MKGLLIALALMLLSGCALFRTQHNTVPRLQLAPGQFVTLPAPRALGLNLSATQILSATYHIKGKTKHYSSQVQLEVTPSKVVIVALSGWGSTLFSVHYNGVSLESSSLPMPNANMGIRHSVADFMLTYAPVKVLRRMLAKTNLTLKASEHQRELLQHGTVILRITYPDANHFTGTVIVDNVRLHYRIKILTISHEATS